MRYVLPIQVCRKRWCANMVLAPPSCGLQNGGERPAVSVWRPRPERTQQAPHPCAALGMREQPAGDSEAVARSRCQYVLVRLVRVCVWLWLWLWLWLCGCVDWAGVTMCLISTCCVHRGDFYKRSPLHHAAHAGHTEIVKFLVLNGADVYQKDKYQETPLHAACATGKVEVRDKSPHGLRVCLSATDVARLLGPLCRWCGGCCCTLLRE